MSGGSKSDYERGHRGRWWRAYKLKRSKTEQAEVVENVEEGVGQDVSLEESRRLRSNAEETNSASLLTTAQSESDGNNKYA